MSGRSGPWTGAPAVRTRALAFAWPEQRAVRRESAASHARRARAECRYSREAIVSEPQALVLVPRRQCRAPRRRCCLRLVAIARRVVISPLAALSLLVSMKEDGLSTGAGAAGSGPAGGLVASGAHVSIAPSCRGDLAKSECSSGGACPK